MNRLRSPAMAFLALLALALTGLVVFRLSSSGAKNEGHKGRIITVGVSSPVRQDLDVRLVHTADILPFQQVNLFSRVDGYIQKLHVDKGDFVKAGADFQKACSKGSRESCSYLEDPRFR